MAFDDLEELVLKILNLDDVAKVMTLVLDEFVYGLIKHKAMSELKQRRLVIHALVDILSKKLFKISIKRQTSNMIRKLQNAIASYYPHHLLRLVDIMLHTEEWKWFYKLLDQEGKVHFLNWIKAGILALSGDYIYAVNKFAEINVNTFVRRVLELNNRAQGILVLPSSKNVLMIFNVEGYKRYKLAGVDLTIASVWFFGQYPFKRLIKASENVIFDIGAGLGETTLWFYDVALKFGMNPIIYAFEPDLENVTVLRWNIKANNVQKSYIKVLPAAIGREQRKVILLGSLENTRVVHTNNIKERKAIPMFTLDYLFLRNVIKCPDYVKVDVEGYEREVLEGSVKLLSECKPIVVLSAYHRPRDPLTLVQKLSQIGYKKFTFLFKLPMFHDTVIVAEP